MGRRTLKEIQDWEEFPHRGRPFVRAKVPKGDNAGQTYTVAKFIADRYEVKRFFASGGCGLLLAGRDRQTETEVLVKTTLRYDCTHCARYRDRDGFARQLKQLRQQLQTERRVLVLLKNQGCNGVPNPNDYVHDWNPKLGEPYPTEDGKKWSYDDKTMLASEPYLILEAIEGDALESLLEREMRQGMEEQRALGIVQQITYVLRLLHRAWTMSNGDRWELVYQDLKPANVLLGAHDYAALVDWGGCRLLVNGRVALAGAFTPGYCPPECGLTGVPLTPAADSYTVGSTLYHLLTGTAPGKFLPPGLAGSATPAVLPDRWDWALLEKKATAATCKLVRACLHANPRDRPPDGAALHEEITRLLVAP
jgi:serine/threonine protein kinase